MLFRAIVLLVAISSMTTFAAEGKIRSMVYKKPDKQIVVRLDVGGTDIVYTLSESACEDFDHFKSLQAQLLVAANSGGTVRLGPEAGGEINWCTIIKYER